MHVSFPGGLWVRIQVRIVEATLGEIRGATPSEISRILQEKYFENPQKQSLSWKYSTALHNKSTALQHKH